MKKRILFVENSFRYLPNVPIECKGWKAVSAPSKVFHSVKFQTHQTGRRSATPMHTYVYMFCACHSHRQHSRAMGQKRLAETGLGLVTACKQVGLHQARGRCTDPSYIPGARFGAAWQSLVCGRAWHCCQLDNLHRTGIGWQCQGPRRRGGDTAAAAREARRQKGTTSQHRRHSVFTTGRAWTLLFVTKESDGSKESAEWMVGKQGWKSVKTGKEEERPIQGLRGRTRT